MSDRSTIVITGGAGLIGGWLRTRLARPDRVLRLVDIADIPAAADGEQVEILSRTDAGDPDSMAQALDGADAVIHLGAVPVEDTWERILSVNIDGSRTVLEAARHSSVRKVVLASSNHAVGFHHRLAPIAKGSSDGLPDDVYPQPDTYYGASKAMLEALGSLYADRYDLDVFALRIGWCVVTPPTTMALTMWLSADDCARLHDACLTTDVHGYRVIWGASANTRRYWSYAGGNEIGYQPQDDSEDYAADAVEEPAIEANYLGGPYPVAELGKPM